MARARSSASTSPTHACARPQAVVRLLVVIHSSPSRTVPKSVSDTIGRFSRLRRAARPYADGREVNGIQRELSNCPANDTATMQLICNMMNAVVPLLAPSAQATALEALLGCAFARLPPRQH